jgi:hypothetical protein
MAIIVWNNFVGRKCYSIVSVVDPLPKCSSIYKRSCLSHTIHMHFLLLRFLRRSMRHCHFFLSFVLPCLDRPMCIAYVWSRMKSTILYLSDKKKERENERKREGQRSRRFKSNERVENESSSTRRSAESYIFSLPRLAVVRLSIIFFVFGFSLLFP